MPQRAASVHICKSQIRTVLLLTSADTSAIISWLIKIVFMGKHERFPVTTAAIGPVKGNYFLIFLTETVNKAAVEMRIYPEATGFYYHSYTHFHKFFPCTLHGNQNNLKKTRPPAQNPKQNKTNPPKTNPNQTKKPETTKNLKVPYYFQDNSSCLMAYLVGNVHQEPLTSSLKQVLF